jgi:VWFA-related protein
MTARPWLALVALLVPAWVASQTFSSRVDSVRVDVLVTAGGIPVTGLQAEDFEVRDNGALQSVRLLEAGSLALDVTVALDLSSSLEPGQFATLRNGVGLLLEALQPNDRAALLTFNQTVFQQQALTSDVSLVRAALEQADLWGGTALADAMYAGITLSEAAGRRPLLIVFSDGIDTTSWLSAGDVINAARRFETVVYAVSTAGSRETPQLLRDVTSQTGGNLLHVTSRDFEASFIRILEEFRQRYLLSYTLGADPARGWHRIEVRVKRRGASVKARSGYFVGSHRPPAVRR